MNHKDNLQMRLADVGLPYRFGKNGLADLHYMMQHLDGQYAVCALVNDERFGRIYYVGFVGTLNAARDLAAKVGRMHHICNVQIINAVPLVPVQRARANN